MAATEAQKNLLMSFDFIRVCTPDINGCHMTKLIPRRRSQRVLKNDVNMYGGCVLFGPRNQYVEFQEMVDNKNRNAFMYSDFETLCPAPWADDLTHDFKVGEVIANLHWDAKTPVDFHSRVLAQRQLDKLREQHGFELFSAFEPEFRVFRSGDQFEPYSYGLDLYKTSLLARFEGLLMECSTALSTAGLEVQDMSTEHGEGQLEIPLMPSCGIIAADWMFRLKQIVKEVAVRRPEGMQISFMTKPIESESASGNHFNHSLRSIYSNLPVMHDPHGPDQLSSVCRFWIAGLIRHLPAMTALCCPTTNCYSRLHGFVVPGFSNWDIDDRMASIRVKNNSPKSTYVENRLPSSATNPYIVLAAIVAAGLDGLAKEEEPQAKGSSCPDQVKLPETFEQALNCLEQDSVLVDALGHKFVEYFLRIKRTVDLKEIDECSESPKSRLDKERWMYFEHI